MPLDTRIPLMAQPIQMPDFNALAMQRQQQAQNAMTMQYQQAQLARAQRQEEEAQAALLRRQQVGAKAAAGDLAGAREAAMQGGDFDLAQSIQGLSDKQRAEALDRNNKLAAIAFSAKELPYAQRGAFIQAATSHLSGMGFTPEAVAQFDPTDQNIDGIVATTQTLAEHLAQADKDRTYKLNVDKFGEDVRSNRARETLTARGQDISAATTRRGQDISASTARRGQDMTQARANQGATGPQGTKQQQGLARQKLSSLSAIEGQIARVDAAMKTMERKGYSGALLGHLPGAIDSASNTFDKSVAGLAPLIRQLTRVPGEGAMSDYESRLASLTLPSRVDTPEGRREALTGIRELISNIRDGYQGFLGEAPAASGGSVIRYDAKGNRIK